MHRMTAKLAGPLAAVLVCLSSSAEAQELGRDSVWNGVVAGAAVGAVVDAAIPRRAPPGPGSATPGTSRQVSLTLRVQFSRVLSSSSHAGRC